MKDKRDECGCHRECTTQQHDCAVPCRWPNCLTEAEHAELSAELAADETKAAELAAELSAAVARYEREHTHDWRLAAGDDNVSIYDCAGCPEERAMPKGTGHPSDGAAICYACQLPLGDAPYKLMQVGRHSMRVHEECPEPDRTCKTCGEAVLLAYMPGNPEPVDVLHAINIGTHDHDATTDLTAVEDELWGEPPEGWAE